MRHSSRNDYQGYLGLVIATFQPQNLHNHYFLDVADKLGTYV